MPRRLITVQGVVQGVGFRPFVHGLASRLGLGGFVRNEGGSVVIEVEGEDSALESFLAELPRQAPRLSRIHQVSCLAALEQGETSFSIRPSQAGAADGVLISPDIATCDLCLAELADPSDRRFGHAFLNCTACGPRLTIVTGAPYDRPQTTMAGFTMCPDCRREYADPADRRFHAQPIACPGCGPRLFVLDADGKRIEADDPLRYAAAAMLGGMIGAVKGLGGYHLVCDARIDAVVAELRRRKHRDARPFAIMVRDAAAARQVCEVAPQEELLLVSPARPIVLLRKRRAGVAEQVAPGNPCLGVMLPYTPLHHLLLKLVEGIPLVMTSGNQSDEPIAYEDCSAMARLKGLADFFIAHDRPIRWRCDDSVVRVVGRRPLPVRRSRGYAPAPIALVTPCPMGVLALGGQLKATFALGRDREAIVSHHLGDLDYYESYAAYVRSVEHYERLFAFKPELLVHDLHPDYMTTRYAQERLEPAARLAVQHHHAHLASCLAEHGLDAPVIGVIFDGTGYGADGAVWGGEFLIGDCRRYRRAAHLRYVAMPGGETAIREPWRMAAAHWLDAGLDGKPPGSDAPAKAVDTIGQMIAGGFNTQRTSSAGRLFDAVAAMVGLRSRVRYEGQAAMELEWLATDTAADGSYPYQVLRPAEVGSSGRALEVDTRPLIAAIADELGRGESAARVARRFHSTLVEMIAETCGRLRAETGLEIVVLSGGVFANAILLSETIPRLEGQGFRVCRHELVPPNDGGLCLGQLAVAAARYSCHNAPGLDEPLFDSPQRAAHVLGDSG